MTIREKYDELVQNQLNNPREDFNPIRYHYKTTKEQYSYFNGEVAEIEALQIELLKENMTLREKLAFNKKYQKLFGNKEKRANFITEELRKRR